MIDFTVFDAFRSCKAIIPMKNGMQILAELRSKERSDHCHFLHGFFYPAIKLAKYIHN